MAKPFFSICVPYFNARKYLARCLESICAQEFRDFEVLILDDGSSTPLDVSELLSGSLRMAELHLKVIRATNGGTYAARQKAIAQARGDYIFCIDADDKLINSTVLLKIESALKCSALPDVLMFNVVRENGDLCVDYSGLSNQLEIAKKDVIENFFLKAGWNSMFSFVFRRELFVATPNRPKLVMAEDRLQKAEIFAKAESFFLLNEPLYVYCDVPDSKMNVKFTSQDYYNRLYINHQIKEMLDNLGASEYEWAASSNIYIMASLFELACSSTLRRNERLACYRRFRDESECEESLALLNSRYIACKDYLCLRAFALRRWIELDLLLLIRSAISRLKNEIRNM